MKGLNAQARQGYLRALELDPNNTAAMSNLSIQEIMHGRLDEGAYWGRRFFLPSGKGGNDVYHLIVPLLNLRADRESRILLEEGERLAPGFSRVQMMLSVLDLFEGHVDRAVSRAEALVAAHPQNKEVKFFRADLAFLLDAPDLEKWLAPLMERGASNSLWVAETVRMRYAYALARRGDTMKAAALIDETERILSSTTEIIKGSPNPKYISTSYVERQNLTRRMRIRRFTRLTNGFSKKLENHTAAVALLDAAEKKAA